MKKRHFERVRFELQQRSVVVSRVERTSEGFITIVFTGPLLAQFNSLSFDDHIKFIFTNAAGETVRRDYTPRSFNTATQELAIEFALHAHGDASDWAKNAKLGDSAVIAGPKGSMVIPRDFDWHLLIADSSSLPALARRLEELPVDAQMMAFIQVEHVNDRRKFETLNSQVITWVETHQEVVTLVEGLALPAGEGFSWVAGEHAFALQVRDILLEKGQAKELMKAAAYWKKGAANFHEKI
ncbi:siderophore-interacting protein [Methylophilus flavus]|uniref:Siderophore-interacting protein n=1 Tax=Methylophilus flavus TaxID=640084 RepID=A0ABW3P5C7_9PROT